MSKDKKGFTIIEVVLVLAIAGLIFMMVFVALPSLQRSQRNTQRSDDMSRFLTAVQQYQSNNKGKTPWENGDNSVKFIQRYIDASVTGFTDGLATPCSDQFQDPDGTCYGIATADLTSWGSQPKGTEGTPSIPTGADPDHIIYVASYAECTGVEGTVRKMDGPRNVAMLYKLEGGAIVCNDNN